MKSSVCSCVFMCICVCTYVRACKEASGSCSARVISWQGEWEAGILLEGSMEPWNSTKHELLFGGLAWDLEQPGKGPYH